MDKLWYEKYLLLSNAETYFENVLRKTEVLSALGKDIENVSLVANVMTTKTGVFGILSQIREWKNVAFDKSGATLIPVLNMDKPNFTVVKGGAADESPNSKNEGRARNEPTTHLISIVKNNRT